MSDPTLPAAQSDDRRPVVLLIVYSWDMFLAILAIFGALAPFAGQVAIGPRELNVPLLLQVLAALSSAAYAAVLIMIASLLTRRQRWVQRLHIATMSLAILFAIVSILVAFLTGGVDTGPLLVTALFVLIDLLTIVLITERRVKVWYTDLRRPPRYALGTLGFWALTSLALIAVDAIR